MSTIDFIHKSPENADASSPKLISEELGLMSVNDEFNQYMEYYMESIRMKSKGVVLIVEDDLFCRQIVKNAVKEYSREIQILTAASMDEGLNVLKATPCDLVISDFYLEGTGTGLDLCRRVLTEYPKIQCVMMSNMGFFKYREVASATDRSPEFMEKPVSPSLIKKYLTTFFEDL